MVLVGVRVAVAGILLLSVSVASTVLSADVVDILTILGCRKKKFSILMDAILRLLLIQRIAARSCLCCSWWRLNLDISA